MFILGLYINTNIFYLCIYNQFCLYPPLSVAIIWIVSPGFIPASQILISSDNCFPPKISLN